MACQVIFFLQIQKKYQIKLYFNENLKHIKKISSNICCSLSEYFLSNFILWNVPFFHNFLSVIFFLLVSMSIHHIFFSCDSDMKISLRMIKLLLSEGDSDFVGDDKDGVEVWMSMLEQRNRRTICRFTGT